MKELYLSVLCDAESGRGLSFEGERAGDELLNGDLRAGQDTIGRVVDGVASFVEKRVNWPPEEIEKLRAEGWIPRNWRGGPAYAARRPAKAAVCDALAQIDGVILEVAAGPGGGNMPAVLARNPAANMIINDIFPDVLQLWQEFFREEGHGSEACLAAFDANRMPVKTGSLAAVSSVGGLGEVSGTEIFEEVARVLAPGAALYADETIIDPDDWSQMPAERRSHWAENSPSLTQGVAAFVEEAGLVIESRQLLPGRELKPDEGGLPRDAADHGVTLHTTWEYVVARKP